MKCSADIQDNLGGKYECSKESTKKIVIKQYVPHLKKHRVRYRLLCDFHAKRFVANMRYQIKHCYKQAEIEVINLN